MQFSRRIQPHAYSHPGHLRHLHGRAGRAGARGGPHRHRLRRGRVPADERPVARAGHRADRGLWRRADRAEARRVRDRQRGQPRAADGWFTEVSADGSHSRRRRALHQRPAVAAGERAAGPPRAGRGGHARQDDDHVDAGLDSGERGPRARLPGRWGAAQLRHQRTAGLHHPIGWVWLPLPGAGEDWGEGRRPCPRAREPLTPAPGSSPGQALPPEGRGSNISRTALVRD